MNIDNLAVGDVCYQYGIVDTTEGAKAVVTQAYVYIGYHKRNITSSNCDKPYHYYGFLALNGFYSNNKESVGYHPSREAVEKCMLSYGELLEHLAALQQDGHLDKE